MVLANNVMQYQAHYSNWVEKQIAHFGFDSGDNYVRFCYDHLALVKIQWRHKYSHA
ncbi:hypothetical protein DXX94_08205 [Thalassotalea euphylliae]|uniref:Uncharacterized protein n=1 Tax=Thalassotalea euphylliae TaxID=1655234 RepID=A0A3E0U188_9GAMM|nr:hypothetical protein DXX94_08205 [Thalassotalea euphylliae]